MKKLLRMRSNLSFNIISAVVLLLVFFSLIVSAIGYVSFTNAFYREYRETTCNMAYTASMLIKPDRIDTYLEEGGTSYEYLQSKNNLDKFCLKMDVSIVYVIKVDTSDYGSFTSIFNSVGRDTPYTPWELGYQQETTNDEYIQVYKDLYEGKKQNGTIYRTRDLRGAPPHITTLVPIRDSNGEVVSLMCIQRPMKELRDGRRPYLINIAISTVVLAVLVALSSAIYIRREFVTPLRGIANETNRFARENRKGAELGSLSKINEIATIGVSIDKMEDDMLKYIENLTAVTSEKERIGAELSIASTIQENSVPNIFPAFPARKDFDIFASMTPAKEVGGDFYNFFLVDDNHIAMVMADVSGKGIPAALFMMVTNILISDRTRMGGTPAEILTYVNENICAHNKADMFVTVWLGILEISTGKIIAANAGHDDPAICRKGESFEIVKNKHGLVVGAMAGIKYKDFEIQLNKGDKIFLYTDGLPEATDKDNKMFTVDGMINALNKHKNESPEAILEGINKSVGEFVGDAPQFDDLTMLCLELKENDNNMKTLVVDATNDNLHEVMDFVDSFLEENGATMKAQMQVDLSIEEIFVNIASYAYGDETGKAEISVENNSGEIIIELKDSGIPYNPLEKADPDITLTAQEREIGGLGIFLTKKNMDSVSYSYENNQNILRMTKNIN